MNQNFIENLKIEFLNVLTLGIWRFNFQLFFL